MTLADNQAVECRPGGEAVWLTSFITPSNPDVMLLYQQLTNGLVSREDRILACWRHVAAIRYRETVGARLTIGGRSHIEPDAWLYPGEIIKLAPWANCANKSFLLTSLLRNELPASDVQCALGHITLDGIGAHAWVTVSLPEPYLLETTLKDIQRAFIPLERADAYEPVIYFNDEGVQVLGDGDVLNEHFGYCPVPWLKSYLCERCLNLEAPS